jgi:chromosome segregation ATPase
MRCEEVDIALKTLLMNKEEVEALTTRVAPLANSQTGITSLLRQLHDMHEKLGARINHLEQDDGVGLAGRVEQLTEARTEVEQRLMSLQEQFGSLGVINREITELFTKLNDAQRAAQESNSGIRTVFSKAS